MIPLFFNWPSAPAQEAVAEARRKADLRLQGSELATQAMDAAKIERCERLEQMDNVNPIPSCPMVPRTMLLLN